MILVRFTIDNRNRLIFYGNMVGYVKDDAAVVDESHTPMEGGRI